ncbi:MAG: 4a-hydroxytetrahydrobiopterin dehydratase, partial [Planctomycetes bacterium]|nr:4a-hydroxytetrahydrobiopterin dehydratase [Planctomycetota bacterium]
MSRQELTTKKCVPCEGGVPVCTREETDRHLHALSDWQLTSDGKRIHRSWVAKDFMTAIRFFQQVAELAEAEGHHPDLHLANYRQVTIEIWTHAIGGLSENDFILAAKIDRIPFGAEGNGERGTGAEG